MTRKTCYVVGLEPDGTWGVLDVANDGVVMSHGGRKGFKSKEEAVAKEEEIAKAGGWELTRLVRDDGKEELPV